ncbi:MAG: nitrous oxide reductase accessory protein NosL [Geminicoccaceae bacterium]
MKHAWLIGLVLLAGCDNEQAGNPPPPPAIMGSDAVGHFCQMNVAEHPGPKGQAHIAGHEEPVWFPSVRDLLTYRVLPGETDKVVALYVSDMSAAPSFEKIDPARWIAVDEAFYVIDSQISGGMGASEAVPFSHREDADAFQARHGGKVVRLAEIDQDWIFGENP